MHMQTWTVKTRDELLDLIRARRDELDVTNETLDGLTGLPDRYVSKLLGTTPVKNLGPLSLARFWELWRGGL